jgi:acyl carrier protein
MADEILQALSDYIARDLLKKKPGKPIDPDAKLISSGMIDSFSLVDLAMFIEERFRVRVADTELNAQTFDTLNELAALVAKRKK